MKMYQRLRYLYLEGFEVCSLMGYDGKEEEMGEGKIIYRLRQPNGNWRIFTEYFSVSYDEMQACTRLYMQHLHA